MSWPARNYIDSEKKVYDNKIHMFATLMAIVIGLGECQFR